MNNTNEIFNIDITVHEKLVLIFLSSKNECETPSYQTIADKCSISRRKAISCVKELESNHLISKNRRTCKLGASMTNKYLIKSEVVNGSQQPGTSCTRCHNH